MFINWGTLSVESRFHYLPLLKISKLKINISPNSPNSKKMIFIMLLSLAEYIPVSPMEAISSMDLLSSYLKIFLSISAWRKSIFYFILVSSLKSFPCSTLMESFAVIPEQDLQAKTSIASFLVKSNSSSLRSTISKTLLWNLSKNMVKNFYLWSIFTDIPTVKDHSSLGPNSQF